ncbi:hypothetical protein [Pseudonocardia xinjiangensis]|uniref:hypothetical protein n=1 Tax=Pseudonocardia xinjiangensis TaxID=75289 RepID=UPI001B7D0C73|nr:hypothetical protein [Pseudonocardia xinjiangensis]
MGMTVALESMMATSSPVFDDARAQMARALDRLLAAGAAAGATRITAILFDGLRYGARGAG